MTISVSAWSPAASAAPGAEEYFIVVSPPGRGTFASQIARTFELYETERDRLGLDAGSAVTVTCFLSDAANQEDELRMHEAFARLVACGPAVTVIQQPPVGAKLGLLAYHIRRAKGAGTRTKFAVAGVKSRAMGLEIAAGPYRTRYLRNLLSPKSGDAGAQTGALLGVPGIAAQSGGITLGEVIRTWLYVANIDVNYGPVSSARNEIFDRYGITREIGFPASTGIDGRSSDRGDLLLLDVLAIQGLEPGQNRRMEAPTHMNATVEYGVTFERGREVVFGDRRHLYVSGTASISNQGEILYPGDVVRQTGRATENVAALLAGSGAEPGDLCYLIVYLRDSMDAGAVEAVLAAGPLAGVPRILVHAPVCRPGWLVEMEGVAIDGKGDPRFARF
jgi:enamine deaminase RidA (YjgF/YER057c/UK114 family)